MGFVKRHAAKREDQVWRNVLLVPGERRVDYAHLVAAVSEDVPGTALLTDRRFLWLDPAGTVRMDFSLADCGASQPQTPGRGNRASSWDSRRLLAKSRNPSSCSRSSLDRQRIAN